MTDVLALKSFVFLAMIFLASPLLKRAAASNRRLFWSLAILWLAALPFLSVSLPSVQIERPQFARPQSQPLPTAQIKPDVSSIHQADPAPTTPMPPPARGFDFARLLVLAWVVVAASLLLRLGLLMLQARRLVVASLPVNLEWEDVLGGSGPSGMVRTHPAVTTPMTVGLAKPVVLVPTDFDTWDHETIRAVLLHEFAHVAQYDWAVLIFSQIVACGYWFNPLAWLTAARLRAEQEAAADDAVLEKGVGPQDYAQKLIDLAVRVRGPVSVATLPVVGSSRLKERVQAIIDQARRRGPLSPALATVVTVVGCACVGALASARLIAPPELVQGGFIDLGNGRWIRIFAVSDLQGEAIRSWDLDGKCYSQPYWIDDSTRKALDNPALNPIPEGSAARYLFAQCNFDGDLGVSLASKVDAHEVFPQYISLASIAGTTMGIKLAFPNGASTSRVDLWSPTEGWRHYATTEVVSGASANSEAASFQPQFKQRAGRSLMTFNIPDAFANDQCMVAFKTRDGDTRQLAERYQTGPTTLEIGLDPKIISSVELLHRRVKHVALSIPLQPDSGPSYCGVPLPEIVTAVNGRATADTSTFEITSISDLSQGKVRAWGLDGQPVPADPKNPTESSWLRPGEHLADVPFTHNVGIRIRCVGRLVRLYDLNGIEPWPVRMMGFGYPNGVPDDMLVARFAEGATSINLLAQCAKGNYRKVATFPAIDLMPGDQVSNFTPGGRATSHLGPRPWWTVNLPRSVVAEIQDRDFRFDALDRSGRSLTLLSTARSDNKLAFQIDGKEIPQTLVANVRDYAYIRFLDVPLVPKP